MHRLFALVVIPALILLTQTGCGDVLSAADAQDEGVGTFEGALVGPYSVRVYIAGEEVGRFDGVDGLTTEMELPGRDRDPGREGLPPAEEIDGGGVFEELEPETEFRPVTPEGPPVPSYNRVAPGEPRYLNIVLKQGPLHASRTSGTMHEYWRQWFAAIVEIGTNERRRGETIARSGHLEVLDDAGRIVDRYEFTRAWPCRISGYRIDAQGRVVHTGEIELVVGTLTQSAP
ncbi:MAG: phage tail protein [Planctomycetota bacterium]|nr:phage tail protein [Planctomycetota bacterium]